MGWMPRRLILLLAGSALLLAPLLTVQLATGAGRAQACSCAWPWPPPLEALKEASAVFSGRVVSFRRWSSEVELGDGGGPPYWPVGIEVDTVWKGPATTTTFVYVTHATACGYPLFKVGESFLIHAHERHGAIVVSACSRTRPLNSAFRDLFALGEGQTPEPGVTGALQPSGDEGQAADSGTTSEDGGKDAGPETAEAALKAGDHERTPDPGETDAHPNSREPLHSLAWWTPLLAGIAAAALIIRRWARRREPE